LSKSQQEFSSPMPTHTSSTETRPRFFGAARFAESIFRFSCLAVFLILIRPPAVWSGPSFQEVFEPETKNFEIKIVAMPDQATVGLGDQFRLHVVATLTEGWHIYSLGVGEDESLPTRIELDSNDFLPVGDWQESPPEITDDKILKKVVKTHSGRVEFSRLFTVPANLKPRNYPLNGTLTYRSCDNTVCTLPRTIPFRSHVIVKD